MFDQISSRKVYDTVAEFKIDLKTAIKAQNLYAFESEIYPEMNWATVSGRTIQQLMRGLRRYKVSARIELLLQLVHYFGFIKSARSTCIKCEIKNKMENIQEEL